MQFKLHQTLANEPAFRERIRAAIVQAAINFTDDAVTDPDSQARVALARDILRSSGVSSLEQFSWLVAANAAIITAYGITNSVDTISDSDIEYVVAVSWPLLAALLLPNPMFVEPPA